MGVCVPAFADQVTPVTLAVKEVVDNDYCFDRVLTVCEETSTIVEREICTCSLSYPAPKEVCVTKSIEITEVKCEDKIDNVCFNVAKFVDATNVVDQVETIIGEPSCEQITLTLPTQACSKAHHAPAYHHGK